MQPAEREVAEKRADIAGGGDGRQRASAALSARMDGADILARMSPEQTASIKKIKFDVAFREIEDADGSVTREPVLAIEAIEMHDKLRAIEMLAPWFGLVENSQIADATPVEGGGALIQIIPPQKPEEN